MDVLSLRLPGLPNRLPFGLPYRLKARAPSVTLAELMVSALPAGPGLVIALGQGNTAGGTINLLQQRRQRMQDLMVVEPDWQAASQLATRCPTIDILTGPLGQLGQMIDMPLFTARAIMMNLSWRTFSAAGQYRILRHIFRLLMSDGVLIVAGLGTFCPVSSAQLDRLGLIATRTATVWHHLRPVSVWKIDRLR